MRIGLAQINTTVGDLRGNATRILEAYREACEAGAELVLTPELALTGYPPQDLVFKSRFVPLNLELLAELHQQIGPVPIIVGHLSENSTGQGNPFRNSASVLESDRPIRTVHKTLLPTYDVFDEARYFQPAGEITTLDIAGRRIGITLCEDIWPPEYLPRRLYQTDPVQILAEQGAQMILNLSASPFHLGKPAQRLAMLVGLARRHRIPFVYCNAIGGNDQLVFDGASVVVARDGTLLHQSAAFREEIAVVDLAGLAQPISTPDSESAQVHAALCLGLRDYMAKCGFKTAVLGLSGGIDSAVTACIAADTLGPENVLGVAMPTKYSSQGSIDDSVSLAANLGISLLQIPIQESFDTFLRQFDSAFADLPSDTTEENMQPRLRGMTLMALSNKFGHLVLSTGNKSELAVGYCTLYGDMCGGLAVISDLPKTAVYSLAEWINRDREIIPRSTLEKPPSAELKPDQRDQDTLPPYALLDAILQLYVEEQMTAADIIRRGFDEATVRWVARRVDLNEYKREQAAPGLRITSKAFGAGRRMPIAQRFVD